MLSTLTIRDEILSASGNPDPDFTLVFYSEFITVRELIQARVKHEVDTYNQTQPEHFRGFVQPSETEQTLNG
ncbi:MAG TPA: hypothetical protein VEF04_12045, partial [Blastocatellia bacterium]|nr:hypothetical protein [Blastocatellia bacterium]